MDNLDTKSIHLSGEEFIKLGEIIKPICERGISEHPPKLVILMGGVGAGKTTIRRQKYSNGFVHFDFGEYFVIFSKKFGENNPKLTGYTAIACDLILKECLSQKKNIVIEIIGDKKDSFNPIIDGMVKAGYSISIEFIECDPIESYKRHLKAVDEDKDYFSAFYTQEPTLSSFYFLLGLGDMPKTT
jgi:hypothetical protein